MCVTLVAMVLVIHPLFAVADDHVHNWSIIEKTSVNVATVKCSVAGCAEARTVSIAAQASESSVYTGQPIAAVVTKQEGFPESVIVTTKYTGRGTTTYDESETAPTDAGKYTATATVGGGETPVTISADYEITPKPLTDDMFTLDETSFVYNGSAQEPIISLKDGDTPLTLAKDYTFHGTDITWIAYDVGTYTILLDGLGNYGGTASATWSITAKSIEDATVTITDDSYTYDGQEKTPTIAVTDDIGTLELNTDYEIDTTSTTSATNAGDYTVKVSGKGNYEGSTSGSWTIAKVTPVVETPPTASPVTAGEPLSTAALTGGVVKAGETVIEGTFAWQNPTDIPTAAGSYPIVFTPADTVNYNTATANADVTLKERPEITTPPTASAITYGQTLANSTLDGGVANVEGSFTWAVPATAPAVSDSESTDYDVRFTPTDEQYGPITIKVKIKVNKADTTVTTAPTASAITRGQALSASTLTGGEGKSGDKTVPGTFAWADGTVIPAQTGSYPVVFTPSDTENYNTAETTATVTVNEPAPEPVETVVISYEAFPVKGGTLSLDQETVNAEEGPVVGSTATANSGYEFLYWEDSYGNIVSRNKTFVPKKDSETGKYVEETYTANFAKLYTIKIDPNGGKVYGSTKVWEKKIREDETITLPTPTRDGYTFDYWKGSKYAAGAKYTVTEDHTFTAQWKIKSKVTPKKVATVSTVNSGKTGSSKTSDTGSNTLWIILLIASIASITLIVALRREHSRQ